MFVLFAVFNHCFECRSFLCLSGYSGFLPGIAHPWVRLTGDYKLPAGVNVSVMSRCVNPKVNRRR